MMVFYGFIACICGYLAVLGYTQTRSHWHLIETLQRIVPQKRTHLSTEKLHHDEAIKQGTMQLHRDEVESTSNSDDEDAPHHHAQPQSAASLVTDLRMVAPRRRRVIVAMTGATGAILGIRLLEKLKRLDIETHLIISSWAEATIKYETEHKASAVRSLATKVYSAHDVAAPVSSGSFKVDAMFVVPCSMKTLSSIAAGYGSDLVSRAADVTIKERRKLILVARETPLSGIHLENMVRVTQNGAIIFPPVPAFYTRPQTVDDIVEQSIGRMLDLIDVDTGGFARWDGMHKPR